MRQSSLTPVNDEETGPSLDDELVECSYNIPKAMQVTGKSIYYAKAS